MDENFFPEILSIEDSYSGVSEKWIDITTISGKEEVYIANKELDEKTTNPLRPNPLYTRDIIRVFEE